MKEMESITQSIDQVRTDSCPLSKANNEEKNCASYAKDLKETEKAESAAIPDGDMCAPDSCSEITSHQPTQIVTNANGNGNSADAIKDESKQSIFCSAIAHCLHRLDVPNSWFVIKTIDIDDKQVWCTCCNEVVVDSSTEEILLQTIKTKMDRHLQGVSHCFLATLNPPISDASLSAYTPSANLITEKPAPYICICRHTSLSSLSTGTLRKCFLGVTSCNGWFHPTCCSGGYRQVGSTPALPNVAALKSNELVCSLCVNWIQKRDSGSKFEPVLQPKDVKDRKCLFRKSEIGCASSVAIVYDNLWNVRNSKDYRGEASLLVSSEMIEIKGMMSQVEALAKYYSSWGSGRRADLCRKSNKVRATSTAAGLIQTVDNVDRMRLASSHNFARIIKLEIAGSIDVADHITIMDVICRYFRFCWRTHSNKHAKNKS